MKYSENYSKLQNKYYTTIRRYSKGKLGDIVVEKYPLGTHKARIYQIDRATLDSIPLDFLQMDTDRITRQEIYLLFQSFYRKTIDFKNEFFYIYYLEKLWGATGWEQKEKKLFFCSFIFIIFEKFTNLFK